MDRDKLIGIFVSNAARAVSYRFCLAICFLLFARSATAETVQLVREHGVYMVPVQINGAVNLPFILDSGASEVSIPADVFMTLTRTNTVTMNDFIGTGTYVLADGSEQPSQRFILHELRVGNHVIKNVIANVAPVKGDPLLGQSFLFELPAWTIDNARHALVLSGGSRPNDVRTARIAPPGVTAPGNCEPKLRAQLAVTPLGKCPGSRDKR
jgi:hypothetical protein